MEQQQWSEWIEWKGGECPIPHARAGEWQVRSVDSDVSQCHVGYCVKVHPASDGMLSGCWQHDEGYWPIVAYRVRLTAQQPTEPATTESDAGMVKYVPQMGPEFELQFEAEEAPGLLVVAPMERLGATRWGAE